MKRKVLSIIFFWVLLVAPVFSQTKVEVITKTIEDQFRYNAGYTLRIEGNSANITIKSWNQKEIKIIMQLISKGLTKAVAEKELGYQKYVIDQINETYVIRNYLLLPAGLEKLSTIQETKIDVLIPEKVTLDLKNAFGNTSIQGLTGKLEIENEYGDLVLEEIEGEALVNSTFGDLKIDTYDGSFTGSLEHTSSDIETFSGTATIKTNLGDLRWKNSGDLRKLKITAEKSDVNLSLEGTVPQTFYWQLKTKYGEIEFPAWNSSDKKITFGSDKNSPIEISTDFGKIVIEE